ncbi:hypothetical protein [Nannocystis pusilla]
MGQFPMVVVGASVVGTSVEAAVVDVLASVVDEGSSRARPWS